MSTMSNNSIEMLIAKAASAQKAGVFESTSVDVSALVAQTLDSGAVNSRLVRFYEKALVGLPLAACLGIVIGLGIMTGGPNGSPDSMLSSGNLSISSQGLNDTASMVASESLSLENVTRCFAGPGESVGADCGFADLDSDGDVDLADLGTYQQQFALVN